MISCTEFIPAYSELFTYLEGKYGFEEVEKYWNDIFNPERNGFLNQKVSKGGIRGCYEYWSHTLNEEAADFTLYLNEKDGWFMIKMHHCPSKGRLLEFEHITPYHKYCLHCDLYRKTIEKYGFAYEYDFTETDKAICSLCVYDPKIYKGKKIVTDDTIVMDRQAGDNRYFHKDFHNSMNMGVDYIGKNFGKEELESYLQSFSRKFYAPLMDNIRIHGLSVLKDKIEETYAAEEAGDSLHFKAAENRLEVTAKYCPAVIYLREAGYEVSPWYVYTIQTVMQTLAEDTGYKFKMNSYDEKTGAAAYDIWK
ncbi:MAG: hypothetical protein WCG21_10450 [Eubacteriales bacterium]